MLQLPARKTAIVAAGMDNDKTTRTALMSQQNKDKTAVVDEAHAIAGQTPVESQYLGCFVDDAARDLGAMEPGGATYTHATCLARCQGHQFMSLQWGGECYCADAYGTAPQYVQADESDCDKVRNPCSSSSSHNCGGAWHQAIYQISGPLEYLMVDGCPVDGCPNDSERALVSADSGATASVRCCTIEAEPVSDSDHVGCESDKTYAEATAICAVIGQRLCTKVDIEQRLCCGTGCNFDGHQVWALHESINPDYSTSHRGMYLGGYASGDSTVRPVAEAQARCDELESACGGITCRSKNSCTVRAGTNLRTSPSGEFSFQMLA